MVRETVEHQEVSKKQDRDVEAEEYSTSGNLKKASGFFLAAGNAISFVAEVMNWKK